MESPGDLIIVGIIVLILALVMVNGVEGTVPLYARASFDDTCNSYLAIIERDSGLTTAQKNNLIAELNDMGITNVVVTAPLPSATSWGQKLELKVTGEYSYETTNPTTYSKTTVTKPIKYQMRTVVLMLPN